MPAPDHLARFRDFEYASAVGFADQHVAVRQVLVLAAALGVEIVVFAGFEQNLGLIGERLDPHDAAAAERLRIAGLTDSLTGLYNRRHLQHRLEQELARAGRYGQSLACLFIDADHFKRINDTYGHPAGDQVLVALAQRLRSHLRGSDLASRYGG